MFATISFVCLVMFFPSTVARVGVWGISSVPFVSVVPDSCTIHLFTTCVVISSIHVLSTTGVFCSISCTLSLFSSLSSPSAIDR